MSTMAIFLTGWALGIITAMAFYLIKLGLEDWIRTVAEKSTDKTGVKK